MESRFLHLLALGLMGACLPFGTWGSRIVYDFETGNLQGWKVTEGFFGKPVSDLSREFVTGKPCVKGGKWFLTTFEDEQGRPTTKQMGRVQSPLIRLASPQITFRLGCGSNKCDFRLVDRKTGEVLAYATGQNDQPLLPARWNVPKAVGREVFFCLSDLHVGHWACIAVDDIVCEGEVLADDFATRTIGVYEPRPDAAAYAAVNAAVRELGARFSDYPAAAFLSAFAQLQKDDAPCSVFEAKRVEALIRAG
ncbi:MAG: hypothetical protein MJ249_12125 [Kiritimatiellae bacterium]|nr:hypothetical protein [Kiritimatiellia bacterium]